MTTIDKSDSRLESVQASARQDGSEGQPSERSFQLYVIKPDAVQKVWESKEPNALTQAILLEHIEEYGESIG